MSIWICKKCETQKVMINQETLEEIQSNGYHSLISLSRQDSEGRYKICPNCNADALGLNNQESYQIVTALNRKTNIHEMTEKISRKKYPFWDEYKKHIIEKINKHYNIFRNDKSKGAELFLTLIQSLRQEFLDFSEADSLNYGSFAGLLLEWIFKFALENCIKENHKNDTLKAINRYKIKINKVLEKNKTNFINIDVAVVDKNMPINGDDKNLCLNTNMKMLFCLEIKTNSEDGFEKYYKDREMIMDSEIILENFEYHYISGYVIPGSMKIKRNYKDLVEAQQLWNILMFNLDLKNAECFSYCVDKCKELLARLYSSIEKYNDK